MAASRRRASSSSSSAPRRPSPAQASPRTRAHRARVHDTLKQRGGAACGTTESNVEERCLVAWGNEAARCQPLRCRLTAVASCSDVGIRGSVPRCFSRRARFSCRRRATTAAWSACRRDPP